MVGAGAVGAAEGREQGHGQRQDREHAHAHGRVRAMQALLAAAVLLVAACRDADPHAAPMLVTLPIVPNVDGSSGCVGPDRSFTPGLEPVALDLGTFTLGPASQVAAARGADLLYVTGAEGAIASIDLADPGEPVVTLLVAPGIVADLLAALDAPVQPELSGLAVLSATQLAVMEHAANVILAVERSAPDQVLLLAGQPNAVPGFADGPALGPPVAARFSFDRPSMLVPVERQGGGKELFVADSGNHAIRRVSGGFVQTIVGTGLPSTMDGVIDIASLDTPVGLVATCTNALLVTELGLFGGGHVLRRLGLASFPPFGGLDGELVTVAGLAGVDATVGGPPALARLSSPRAPATSAEGDAYWIDAGTGVLRRLAEGLADCPLALEGDCEAAVAGPPALTPGGLHSLALTDSGALYVLDAAAGLLLRLLPEEP